MDRRKSLEKILQTEADRLFRLSDEFVQSGDDKLIKDIGECILKINRVQAIAGWCEILSMESGESVLTRSWTGGGGSSSGGGASGGW